MMRQLSSRNQRTKGLRVKHFLQICLLAAVCFWLLYQLKHSYDKKMALDERTSKISSEVADSEPGFMKFGRKDLPHIEDTGTVIETHTKEEESEEVEEEEQDPELKQAMDEEDARGAGDDEIDEQDHERADEEAENGEESADEEEKDGEESLDEEGKGRLSEETELLEDQDHEEHSSQEAREESYKRDDASSAVHKGSEATESEDGSNDVNEEHVENMEQKDVEMEEKANGTDDSTKANIDANSGSMDASKGDAAGKDLVKNETLLNYSLSINENPVERKELEVGLNTSGDSVNDKQTELQTDLSSAAALSGNQTETQGNFTALDAATNSGTVTTVSVHDQNVTAELGTSKEDESNLRNVVEQADKSSTALGQGASEEHSSISLAMKGNEDAVQEGSTYSSNKVVTEEERDARIDLSTLPDIQNEVKSVEDEIA